MLVARWQQNDLPIKNPSQFKLTGCCGERKLHLQETKTGGLLYNALWWFTIQGGKRGSQTYPFNMFCTELSVLAS